MYLNHGRCGMSTVYLTVKYLGVSELLVVFAVDEQCDLTTNVLEINTSNFDVHQVIKCVQGTWENTTVNCKEGTRHELTSAVETLSRQKN